MKVHVKWSLHIKRSLNLDTPCGSYAPLIMGHFWNWMDHNLPTIHGIFKFLDFLERWEQDLQLSCWTNFHLKLPWTRGFEVQNFPFLETSVTSHFLSLAVFVLTWFSSFLSFAMSFNTYSNMNEVYPTHFHLQIHQIMYSWPQLTFPSDRWIWQCIDQIKPQPSTEMAQGWYPSLNKHNIITKWTPYPSQTSSPDPALIGPIQLIRVDQWSKP